MPDNKTISLDNLQTFKTKCDELYATKTALQSGLDGKQDSGNYALQNGNYPDMYVGTAEQATQAERDGDGRIITNTYATKTELTNGLAGKQPTGNYALQNGTYPNMTVGNATNAVNATKATQDASGNNIENTYAKKKYLHNVTLNQDSVFHAQFFFEDDDNTPITSSNIAQRIYAVYGTYELPVSGFKVTPMKGWVYDIAVVSTAGLMKISVGGFDSAFNVNTQSYEFSATSVGVTDAVV